MKNKKNGLSMVDLIVLNFVLLCMNWFAYMWPIIKCSISSTWCG